MPHLRLALAEVGAGALRAHERRVRPRSRAAAPENAAPRDAPRVDLVGVAHREFGEPLEGPTLDHGAGEQAGHERRERDQSTSPPDVSTSQPNFSSL